MVRIRQGSVRYRPVRATSLARCAARVIAMAYAEGVRRVSLGGLETVVALTCSGRDTSFFGVTGDSNLVWDSNVARKDRQEATY